jgi:hypothetical protein
MDAFCHASPAGYSSDVLHWRALVLAARYVGSQIYHAHRLHDETTRSNKEKGALLSEMVQRENVLCPLKFSRASIDRVEISRALGVWQDFCSRLPS